MLKILLIAFAITLASCAHPTAPKPPPVPYCPIVAVEGGVPYLYCYMTDKPKDKWRVQIEPSEFWKRDEKYVCTTDKGYADAYKYGQLLNRWIDKNCGK